MSELIEYLQSRLVYGVEIPPRKMELRYSNQPFCPRKYYIDQRTPLPESATTSITMKLILELGHVFHQVVQNIFAYSHTEDFKLLGFFDEDGNYVEYEFGNEFPLSPTGHADGLIWWRGRYLVMELKTINDNGFVKLTQPKSEHRVQASCYGKRFTKMGFPIDGILFLYVNRTAVLDFLNRNSLDYYQFFEIPFEPWYADWYEQLVDYAVQNNEVDHIPLGICRTPNEMSWCPYSQECSRVNLPYLDKSEEAIEFRKFINILYPSNEQLLESKGVSFLNGSAKRV
ncbi:hypothetical protein [Yersinia ruckeri]|uniref:hypothetical protein n=1 Tax=Yersinia ruckeri TaxID=29486 RepID=UPI00223805E6|nr:hypothetical protein [Yersinia ruckeri]MCW6598880.1 hypothetical protein [Yersinia ruckeri]